jgi:hypothetical protein
MENIIESIIRMEWEFFDKVENEGGRASCQDNWETFSKMRRSQYMAWPCRCLKAGRPTSSGQTKRAATPSPKSTAT